MSTQSSILHWEISRTEEPSVLQSLGRRVGQDWAVNTFTFNPFSTHFLPMEGNLYNLYKKVLLLLVSHLVNPLQGASSRAED